MLLSSCFHIYTGSAQDGETDLIYNCPSTKLHDVSYIHLLLCKVNFLTILSKMCTKYSCMLALPFLSLNLCLASPHSNCIKPSYQIVQTLCTPCHYHFYHQTNLNSVYYEYYMYNITDLCLSQNSIHKHSHLGEPGNLTPSTIASPLCMQEPLRKRNNKISKFFQ